MFADFLWLSQDAVKERLPCMQLYLIYSTTYRVATDSVPHLWLLKRGISWLGGRVCWLGRGVVLCSEGLVGWRSGSHLLQVEVKQATKRSQYHVTSSPLVVISLHLILYELPSLQKRLDALTTKLLPQLQTRWTVTDLGTI